MLPIPLPSSSPCLLATMRRHATPISPKSLYRSATVVTNEYCSIVVDQSRANSGLPPRG